MINVMLVDPYNCSKVLTFVPVKQPEIFQAREGLTSEGYQDGASKSK